MSCTNWNTKAFAEAADVARWDACIKDGADPAAKDDDGWTPLHWAAVLGHVSVVEALLNTEVLSNAEALQNACTTFNRTPLHWAASLGHADVVAALLAALASPDVRDNDCRTPLHLAALNGDILTVLRLLKCGANPIARDKYDNTPCDLAKAKNHWDVVKALQRTGGC